MFTSRNSVSYETGVVCTHQDEHIVICSAVVLSCVLLVKAVLIEAYSFIFLLLVQHVFRLSPHIDMLNRSCLGLCPCWCVLRFWLAFLLATSIVSAESAVVSRWMAPTNMIFLFACLPDTWSLPLKHWILPVLHQCHCNVPLEVTLIPQAAHSRHICVYHFHNTPSFWEECTCGNLCFLASYSRLLSDGSKYYNVSRDEALNIVRAIYQDGFLYLFPVYFPALNGLLRARIRHLRTLHLARSISRCQDPRKTSYSLMLVKLLKSALR